MRYWLMRSDRDHILTLWAELERGRLRQGWGYRKDLDLNVIARAVEAGRQLNKHQEACWRGNRRMLPSEPDGIREGDKIVVPNLPEIGVFTVVQVTGPYEYAILEKSGDHGHVLPVEILTPRAVDWYEPAVSARLRSKRKPFRLMNVDDVGPEVERLLDAVGDSPTMKREPVAALPRLLSDLERATWDGLTDLFHAKEFELPCLQLLQAIYGADNVEHTAGSNERGADAICTHIDPLGIAHRLAIQIKMWDGELDSEEPLKQLKRAFESYDGITGGVILTTNVATSGRFERARSALEEEANVPVRVLLRRDVIRLFLSHLGSLVADETG